MAYERGRCVLVSKSLVVVVTEKGSPPICLVDPVIRAHDAADPSLDGLRERPQLVFVERAIVDVGRIGFASASAPEMLLLVEGATICISAM